MSVNNLQHRKQSGPMQKCPLSVNVYSPTEMKGDNTNITLDKYCVCMCVLRKSLLEICIIVKHSSKGIHAIGYSLVALLSLTNSKLIATLLQENNNTTPQREGKCVATKQYCVYVHEQSTNHISLIKQA